MKRYLFLVSISFLFLSPLKLPAKSIDSGEEFIDNFFIEVKNIPIRKSYEKLSVLHRKKFPFSSFSAWWNKTVMSVTVAKIKKVRDKEYTVVLSYELYREGNNVCKKDQLYLIKTENNEWKIDDVYSGMCDIN